VFECDIETSAMKRLRSNRADEPLKNVKYMVSVLSEVGTKRLC